MSQFAVVIVAADDEQRTILRMVVEGTSVAQVRGQFEAFPTAAADPALRRIADLRPDVVVIDVPPSDAATALRAVEHLHAEVPGAAIFAMGEMSQPHNIVAAMRSGAREYLDRTSTPAQLLEAFVRLSSSQMKARSSGQRGKLFTFINAKGGCGATTVAVNTALSIQQMHGSTVLVDLAPLGHAALHLNAKPQFTVIDALRNVGRLDGSLLESYMVRHENGLHLLAGNIHAQNIDIAGGEFAQLFDLLVAQYKYILVDTSTRLDQPARVAADLSDVILLVANTDVPSLWSAARVIDRLADGVTRERLRLLLNRYRKVPGFSDEDAERATRLRLMWKVPDQSQAVAAAIDRGVPVAQQNHSEIARSFLGLAGALTQTEQTSRSRWSLFRGVA